jgi:hypothetical protein
MVRCSWFWELASPYTSLGRDGRRGALSPLVRATLWLWFFWRHPLATSPGFELNPSLSPDG